MTVHIVVRQQLPATCEEAFDRIHDYRHRLEWDTLLRRAITVDDATPAKGVVAVCTAKWWLGGYAFRTRYVSFDRPHLAAITLESHPPFFTKWAASIRHEPLADGLSSATYTMTFTVRPRLLEPIARAMFRLETRRRLRALAEDLAHQNAGRPRKKHRLGYERVVVGPSGQRFVVAASPRSLAGEPEQWPLPWPLVLGWIAVRQTVLVLRRRPRWQVQITPAWDPDRARVVAMTSKADAIRRVASEVAALASDDVRRQS